MFNNVIDLLNCKNKFSKKGYNIPLHDEMILRNVLLTNLKNILVLYVTMLELPFYTQMTICLRNIFPLFNVLQKHGMSYLLTYKLSQDYLETHFSAIRSRGVFNYNRNALQFKRAYKRLLIRHEVKQCESGNCLFDGIDILHVNSSKDRFSFRRAVSVKTPYYRLCI